MSWRPDAEPGRGGARGALALIFLSAWAVAGAPAAATPAAVAQATTAPAAGAPAPTGAHAGSDVTARVNGNPLLRRDFDVLVQVQCRQRGPGQRRHEDLEAVRGAALDALIDSELLYQRAAQAKIAVTDAEVRAEAAKLRGLLGSPDEAAAFLREAGMSDQDLEDQVRRTLVVKRFVDRDVAPGLEVTEAQARTWYDAHPDEVSRPESVRISQIVVRVAPGADAATRTDRRRKVEEILKEL